MVGYSSIRFVIENPRKQKLITLNFDHKIHAFEIAIHESASLSKLKMVKRNLSQKLNLNYRKLSAERNKF